MKIATPLGEKLGLRLPLIQAPMAGGPTGRLRAASGKPDFLAMWAGQAVPLARKMAAAELIRALEEETLAALKSCAAFVKE